MVIVNQLYMLRVLVVQQQQKNIICRGTEPAKKFANIRFKGLKLKGLNKTGSYVNSS